jgi:hypothetical protein
MAAAMERRAKFHEMLLQVLLASMLAMGASLSCGGGPCGSRVVILDVNAGDAGPNCLVCGAPVLGCNQITVESGFQRGTAVACYLANACPGY